MYVYNVRAQLMLKKDQWKECCEVYIKNIYTYISLYAYRYISSIYLPCNAPIRNIGRGARESATHRHHSAEAKIHGAAGDHERCHHRSISVAHCVYVIIVIT